MTLTLTSTTYRYRTACRRDVYFQITSVWVRTLPHSERLNAIFISKLNTALNCSPRCYVQYYSSILPVANRSYIIIICIIISKTAVQLGNYELCLSGTVSLCYRLRNGHNELWRTRIAVADLGFARDTGTSNAHTKDCITRGCLSFIIHRKSPI